MKLTGLLSLIHQLPAYADLLTTLKSGEQLPALDLPPSVRPTLLAQLATDWQAPILFISHRADTIQRFQQDVSAWLPAEIPLWRFVEPTPLPYERGPWSKNCRQRRLRILTTLANLHNPFTQSETAHPFPVLLTSPRALLQKTVPRSRFISQTRTYRAGQQIELDKTRAHWVGIGYEPVSVVETPGQFSQRGGIVDIYPISTSKAVRIELFGDEIETIRYFDPTTQRSTDEALLDRITVPPAREAMPAELQPLAIALEDSAPSKQDDLPAWQDDLSPLSAGINTPHNEFYLPLIYSQPATLLDYLPEDALIVIDDWELLNAGIHDLQDQADQLANEQPNLPPTYPSPLQSWLDLTATLKYRNHLILAGNSQTPSTDSQTPTLPQHFQPGPRYGGQTRPLLTQLQYAKQQNERTLIVSQQAQRLAELWRNHNERHGSGSVIARKATLPPILTEVVHLPQTAINFVQGGLSEGFIIEQLNEDHSTSPILLNLLTDAELFGWNRPAPRRYRAARPIAPESHFADIHAGNYVVHLEHGIGQFTGLVSRFVGGNEREYLKVDYANGDSVYVPVHHADRLGKWIGAEERAPKLNRIGGKTWDESKVRAQRAVDEMADELIKLYSSRETIAGHAFAKDDDWQLELEASFPYQETEDQLHALAEVKKDMESPHPMDRLICGDVGYGKTEVALRAAFKAINDGKQVAILVPTTVLAQQHYNTFRDRLKPFPVEVRMLSRFRTRARQQRTVKGLREGLIDIVIGTHRLLSDDISFKDLGLLIIDEEQRFGVRHKEKLKQLRTEVDVLTLTATPIPRTLHMSLTGARDISVIATAPSERLPVQTYVGEFDEQLLRQSILRELDRGGQLFLVHNRVQTIGIVFRQVQRAVPSARIAIGHGQMSERELEQVMNQFAEREIDVLLSTTIIESGLDFPNANTLIVDRAENFGLAQLHQLRGRVGRGVNRAYAYFFHSPWRGLTKEAQQRLETIAQESHLGAGYAIAMRDMEIRGVGDLLGAQQSGHVSAVGFDLYTKMLAKAVKRQKAQKRGEELPADLPEVTLIDLPLATYVPADYVPDAGLRLRLYRRMAGLDNLADIEEMAAELADRFGAIPDPVDNLLYQLRIKVLATQSAVSAITTDSGQIRLKMAQLEHINRYSLQRYLGEGARVSKGAIWLSRNIPTREWQLFLVQTLEKIEAYDIRSPTLSTQQEIPTSKVGVEGEKGASTIGKNPQEPIIN